MYENDVNWRRVLAVLLVVMALSVAGLALLGTQTSRILSTVGAAVGPAGGGTVQVPNGDPGAGGDEGAGEERGSGEEHDSGTGGGSTGLVGFQDASRPDLLIIRHGTITIQVADVDVALASAGGAIASLGGYESGSERSGRSDEAHASVVYRFPASSWEAALAAIRGVSEEVLDEQSETTDVSAEIVDIEARIRNLQVTEAAFQSIMDRATVIKDVLNVQAELSRVRAEIEQLSARAAHLREQAAMSTLAVTFVLRPTPVIARQEARFDPASEAEAATASLVGMLQSVAVAGIWFAIVWLPVLVVLAIVVGVTVLVVRRVRGRPDPGAPLAPTGDAA
jgi:uncharacterized protein DUF4349